MKLTSIVLTTGIFPPDIGGPASFIPIFANILVKKGIKVTVITLTDEDQDDSNLPYKVIRINREKTKIIRYILLINAIVKSAKSSDLIFSNTLAFESAIASIVSGKKLVQKIVGDIAWERANGSGRFLGSLEEYQGNAIDVKSRLTNFYRNFAVQRSHKIITPSYYLKDIVHGWNYPKNNIDVINNAVEFEDANKIIKKNKFRIITVARLIPLKGIETILQTLSNINFDFEYIIIGDGPLESKLKIMSNSLNLDTKFLGNISKKEVANWLRSSDICIQNSSHETMPHVLLESMENRCPVIASRVGGTPEIISHEKNGLLFEHNNIEELLSKIMQIKENNDFRIKLINQGVSFTREFSDVNMMVEKYIKVIEGLS